MYYLRELYSLEFVYYLLELEDETITFRRNDVSFAQIIIVEVISCLAKMLLGM
jgi:hypothetical protein